MQKSFVRAITIAMILGCIIGSIGYQKANEKRKLKVNKAVVSAEAELQEAMDRPVLDCKSLEAACADGFIDPSKVTILGGEWAYTADPTKFVALATVRYTNKDDTYETSEFVMVGTFGGKTELFHNLNEQSPYTRENVLQEFGAIDAQRFPLE